MVGKPSLIWLRKFAVILEKIAQSQKTRPSYHLIIYNETSFRETVANKQADVES